MLKRILGAVSLAALAGSALGKAEIDKWGPLIKKAGVYAD